jgi:hypothetical protein
MAAVLRDVVSRYSKGSQAACCSACVCEVFTTKQQLDRRQALNKLLAV